MGPPFLYAPRSLPARAVCDGDLLHHIVSAICASIVLVYLIFHSSLVAIFARYACARPSAHATQSVLPLPSSICRLFSFMVASGHICVYVSQRTSTLRTVFFRGFLSVHDSFLAWVPGLIHVSRAWFLLFASASVWHFLFSSYFAWIRPRGGRMFIECLHSSCDLFPCRP